MFEHRDRRPRCERNTSTPTPTRDHATERRLGLRLLLPVALVGVALVSAVSGNAGTTKDRFDLKGEVYPNYELELRSSANRDLTRIRTGTYRIKIEDMATIHNFRLIGPGVNRATSVPGRVETVWTVTLRPGKYTYLCDPHSSMRGSFRVTG